MKADGTGQKQVASVGCWGHFVVWTADSRAIVFRGERDRQMQIYRVDVASGALTPLPPVRERRAHVVLALAVADHGRQQPQGALGAPDRRVGSRTRSTSSPIPTCASTIPRWSPDGRAGVRPGGSRGADLWTLEGF